MWGVLGGEAPCLPFPTDQLSLLFLPFQPQTHCGGRVSKAELAHTLRMCLAWQPPAACVLILPYLSLSGLLHALRRSALVGAAAPGLGCLEGEPRWQRSIPWGSEQGGKWRGGQSQDWNLGLDCQARGCFAWPQLTLVWAFPLECGAGRHTCPAWPPWAESAGHGFVLG